MSKFKQKQVEVGGVEYTLQRPGLGWYHDNNAECAMKNGYPHQRQISKSYLEHVVVNPKVEIKEFDNLKGTKKNVDILIDTVDDEEVFETFILIHPGISWAMNTTSKNTMNNGYPHPGMMRKEMLEKMVEGEEIDLEYFNKYEHAQPVSERVFDECQNFLMDGKFVELQELLGECERFLTS